MTIIQHKPCIPSKDGNKCPKSIQAIVRGFWVPAFAGMSGIFLIGCGQQSTEVPAVPNAESHVSPTIPTPPKTLTLDDIDFNSFSKELAKWTGLKAGQSRGEAVDNVRLYFAPEQGSQIISTSQSTFEREDGAVLLFSASGLPDDSVKAEEIYLILSGDKGAQTLAAYGSRIKCHRGENTTNWTTKLCP